MNFDDIAGKLLQEAYFSSPNEKITGIKRHIILTQEEYDEPHVDFDYDSLDFDADENLSSEQEYDKYMDEGDAFVQKIQGMSELQGSKLRVKFGLEDMSAQALEKWMDEGAPEGKKGVDLLLNSFLRSSSGVMLTGDEIPVHELQKAAYALAFVTGIKNEKLYDAERQFAEKNWKQLGHESPETLFNDRWLFHFKLDPSTSHPYKGKRDLESIENGWTTKRSGKPLMSGERFRKILEGAQLKTKKDMDVQKPKDQAEMGDPEAAADKLNKWKANQQAARQGKPAPYPELEIKS